MVRYKRAKITINNDVGNVAYVCPTNITAIVMAAVAINTDVATNNIDVNIVPSGDVPLDDNLITTDEPMNVNESVYLDKLIGSVLGAGDYVSLKTNSIGSVNVFLAIQESS